MERQALGQFGEHLAAEFYESRGFTVLDRNWRCREGELDLVVACGRLVVFCEVKTRRGSAYGSPAEAVTRDKQRKLRTAALHWLSQRRGRCETRFDVVSVTVAADAPPRVECIANAF